MSAQVNQMDVPQSMDRIASVQRGKVELSKTFTFEASHVLPKHKGKCSRLHGHSWRLTVTVDGYCDPASGFVVDYGVLSECVKKHVIDVVDHSHLGQYDMEYGPTIDYNLAEAVYGPNFYPSSENLVQAFRRILEPLIPELASPWQQVRLLSLEINETCTSACVWRRQ